MTKKKIRSPYTHGRSDIWSKPGNERAIASELKRLGCRLRACREKLSLSQEHAAQAVGIHDTTLQRLETGQANVTIALLVAICRAYEVPMRSVFEPET